MLSDLESDGLEGRQVIIGYARETERAARRTRFLSNLDRNPAMARRPNNLRRRIPAYEKLCAFTFSDDDGAALAVVRQYVTKEMEFEVLATKIASLMAKHGGTTYQQRCHDAYTRRREEIDAQQREALEAWNPGKQMDHPN